MRLFLHNLGRAFRHRNYRLFFSGQAISLIGTWLQQVAQAWLVYRLTESGALLGLLAVTQHLPALFLGPFAGVAADRYDRRRLIMAAQAVALLTALALGCLTLTGNVTPAAILLLSLVLGFANAVDMPTRQSFIVELVGREGLANAIALNSAMFNGARLLGPAVAGALIPLLGEGWCFMLNALSYIPVLIGLAAIRISSAAGKTHGKSVNLALREGLHYVRRTPAIALALFLLAVSSFAGMPYLVVLPIFAARVLQGGPDTLGLLMAASGAGAFIGAVLLAGRRGAAGLPRLAIAGGLLFGSSLVVLACTTSELLAVPALLLTGVGFMVQHAATNSLVQTIVTGRLRGRVMSIYIMVFAGMLPLGGFLAGWLCDHYGVALVLAGAGTLVFAGSLLGARPLLRHTAGRPD